jgi:hypothetical protein
MAERWNQGGTNYTVKLAELALRAHRLNLAQKLTNLTGMVDIHAPTLRMTPDGQKLIKQLHEELKRVRYALKGEVLP